MNVVLENNFLLEGLNLFLIPLISVYIYHKKTGGKCPVFNLLSLWAIFSVITLITMKGLINLMDNLFDIEINYDSVKYSALALVISIIFSFIAIIGQKYIKISFTTKVNKDNKEKGDSEVQDEDC